MKPVGYALEHQTLPVGMGSPARLAQPRTARSRTAEGGVVAANGDRHLTDRVRAIPPGSVIQAPEGPHAERQAAPVAPLDHDPAADTAPVVDSRSRLDRAVLANTHPRMEQVAHGLNARGTRSGPNGEVAPRMSGGYRLSVSERPISQPSSATGVWTTFDVVRPLDQVNRDHQKLPEVLE